MELKGHYRIAASRDAVWAAVSDPAVLERCIPGCQSLEKISPTEAKAVVAVEIGAFKATFAGTVRVDDADPPLRVSLTGEGRGRPAGTARGKVGAEFRESHGTTTISYALTADLGGRLGEVPSAAAEAKANEIADGFFAALARHLGAHQSGWVDQLDHSMAGVQLGDEPTEDVVIDKAEAAGEVADYVERRLEYAAGQRVLGGPAVWALLALLLMIVFLALLYLL